MSKASALARGFATPRAPKSHDPAEAFLARGAEVPPKASGASAGATLRRDEAGERIALHFPPEVAQALRVRAAETRQSLSSAATQAVLLWLKKDEKP